MPDQTDMHPSTQPSEAPPPSDEPRPPEQPTQADPELTNVTEKGRKPSEDKWLP
jgi:hypothetical protein